MGGTLREEHERSRGQPPGPLGLGSLLSSQADPLPSKPPPGCVGPGGIGGRPRRSEETGGRSPVGGALQEEQERSRG